MARLTTAVPTVITTAVPALAASVSLAAVALTGSGADIPETPPTALAMASSASAEFIGATGLEGPDEGQPNFPATTIPSDVVIALPEEPALPAVTADTGQQSDTPIEPTETSATTTAPDPATAATELPSQDAASSTTTTPLATTSTVVPGPTTTQVNTRPTTTTEAPARPTTTTTTSTTTTTTAPPPPPLPTGTGIQVFTGANVPNDLTVAPFISTTTAFLVEEKQSVTLASSLSAIEVLQGQLTNGNYSDREPIPSGTTVCSWIVLFQTTERSEITPTIDFHLPIIGLERLPETGSFTSELALDNTIYGPGGIGRSDSYKVTGNRIELWLANSPNGIDQLRIITEC